jgi:cell division septation protein DedD
MTPNHDDRIGVPKDELEFEAVEVAAPKRNWGRWLAFLIVLIVGAGAGWYYLGDQIGLGQQEGVPVVRADISPVKIKPADPGGLEVPDRDKLVYDRLNGEGASTEVESLLPPPEEPMEMPVSTETEAIAPTTLEPLVETTTATPEIQAPVALEPSTVPESSSSAPEAPPPPPVPVETVEAAELTAPPTPDPTPTVAPTPTPTVATTPTVAAASATGQFRIQLAALRTHGSAESEWKRLKNAHPGILGPLTLFVVKVDLGGDQGIYYRLRAGDLGTKEAAKAVCDKLAARNVACLVIRPGK